MPRLTPEQATMVEANLGLVGFVLKRRRPPADRWDDEFQDGVLGLMRAAQKFDPTLGYRFSTYALAWIKQGIQRGYETVEGRNFRRAIDKGTDYERPLSLDAHRDGDDDDLNLHRVIGYEDSGFELAEGGETVRRVLRACTTDVDRTITVRLAEGARMADIAREMDVSPSAVQNRCRRLARRVPRQQVA